MLDIILLRCSLTMEHSAVPRSLLALEATVRERTAALQPLLRDATRLVTLDNENVIEGTRRFEAAHDARQMKNEVSA
jgi:hypothetical protein